MSSDDLLSGELLFEIETPLGFRARTTVSYWELITTVKHPIMRDKLEESAKPWQPPTKSA